MTKKAADQPTPSWNFFPTSARLVWNQSYSVFWLLLIPSILAIIGQTRLDSLLVSSFPDPTKVNLSELIQLISSQGQTALAILGIAAIWSLLVYPATMVFATRAVRGEKDQPLGYLLASRKYFWRLYGLAILVNVVIFFGLLALIVPGLIFIRRYILSPYYLVERDLGILESMKLSSKLSKNHKKETWGTIGVVIAMAFASSLVTGSIPLLGLLLGPVVGVLYFFGFSLRQKEISSRQKS